MYYIDLEKMCEDFINGKVEIEDILNKCKLGYFRIVKTIKKYCLNNGILIDDNILYRLEIPISKMYNLLLLGTSYSKIAQMCHCSAKTIEDGLKEYCESNGFAIPKNPKEFKDVELPIKEIYNLRLEGMSYEKLSKEYGCSISFLVNRLEEYCKISGLDLPKKLYERLPVKDIYNLRLEGMSYNKLAKEYGCCTGTIIYRLRKYCNENTLTFPENLSSRDKIVLPMEEVFNLRLKGMSYEKIAKQYGCSPSTVVCKLKEYCDLNGLDFPENPNRRDKVELPMEEIYELKTQGMTYDELSEKYNCNYSTILNRLKSYCEQNNLKIPKAKSGPKQKTLSIEEIYKLKSQGMSYKKMAEKYNCTYVTIRRRLKEYEDELILRNKYLEILLFDFNKIIDNVLNKTIGSFYNDSENKIHDDYSFIKK